MIECLNLEVTADQIPPDAPLYGDGLGLDSIDVLEVALEVSKRYGLQLRSRQRRQPAHFQLTAQPLRLYRNTENPLMARRIVRWLGIAALVIGYPLLAHYTNESAHSGNLGALVAIAPVVLIALGLAWRSPRRYYHAGALVVLCMCALWAGWPALEQHFWLVYWLQHVGHAAGTVHYFWPYLDRRAATAVHPIRRGGAWTIYAAA